MHPDVGLQRKNSCMEKIGICCGEDKKERTGTMTQLEKVKTREALSMYDNLWDQSAIIQQMRATSERREK